ncbi:MAG: 5'-3' exonuclease [Patescibacteria group bacterium]
MVSESKFIIIDGPAVLHRAWHALPKLTDPKGRVISAVYGFASLLLKLLREQQPQYLVVAFDTPAPTFRHQEYKEYKATRLPQPQEFYDQFPIIKDLLKTFGIKILEKDGYEADDLIGALVKKSSLNNLIVTGDLDALQLVNSKTQVYFLRQGISEVKVYDREAIENRYGLSPKRLIDLKALRGDLSDNIPGVRGIGEKTALSLIQKFGSLENVYQHLDEIREPVRNLLKEQKEQALLSKKLVTIKSDIPEVNSVEKYHLEKINREKIKKKFEELGFQSLIKRLEKEEQEKQQKTLF